MNVSSLPGFSALSGPTRSHVRVSLNKRPGTAAEGDFSDRLNTEDLGYACWNKRKRARFKAGTVNLVFVKVGANRYLFVAALRITGVPEGGEGPCRYEDCSESLRLSDFSRRLIVSDSRPEKTKMGAWVFRGSRLADFEVESFDKAEWSKLKWDGYDSVDLSFSRLFDVVESGRYPEYRAHLEDVCGVYALKDRETGKAYVGSAYGKEGVAQRWNHYLDSGHGGNKLLRELFEEKGIDYFRRNFTFTLVREFPLGTDFRRVIAFESKMKEYFNTRSEGYNAN